MQSGRLYLFIFFLIFSSRAGVYAVCYYPDKSIVYSYQTCNPGSDDASACCELSTSVCTENGYCFGNAGVLYRGGCTDRKWPSPNCAQECLNVGPTGFSNILPCSNGVYTTTFCCATGNSRTSCCDDSFVFAPGRPYLPPPTPQLKTSLSILTSSLSSSVSLNIQSPSSIVTSTNKDLSGTLALSITSSLSTSLSLNIQSPTSIVTSTNKDLSGTLAVSVTPLSHTTSKSITVIGLGIGLPLGLLFLLSVASLIYRERQQRAIIDKMRSEYKKASSELLQRKPPDGHSIFYSSTPRPYELEHTCRTPGELDSNSNWIREIAAIQDDR